MSSSFQVMNLFALIDSLVQPLTGEYYTNMFLQGSIKKNGYNAVFTGNDPILSHDLANSTIIADTVFNKGRYDFAPGHYPDDAQAEPTLHITPLQLNQALQNITMSVVYSLDWWSTKANVTQTTYENIYSFSSRPRLIVPYAFSLLATLPFLFIGFRSLRLNGVPAKDGGFIQPLITTTGSTQLRNIAAAAHGIPCKIPKSIGKTRIRFGYLADQDEGDELHKRATFGLEDEIVGS